jgi:peroxiredoxin
MLSLVTIALAHRRRTKGSPAVPVMARSARTNATDEGEASEDGRSSAGAPAFALTSVSGETVSLENLLAPGLPVVLVFASPDCQRCVALEAHLGSWQTRHAATLTLAVISRGEVGANQRLSAAHGLRYVLVQKDREVAAAYDIRRTPAVVWVSPAGRVEAVAGPDPDTISGVILAAALEGRMAAIGK